jgi:predicted RNA-binding protein with PIN domain
MIRQPLMAASIVAAPMRWLVDGMNVIGSRPDGWWRDRPAAMRRLVDELAGLDGEVVVVFDGKPFPIETERVEVRFASRRGPNAADDDIAAHVAADPDAATLTVVTSDADLTRRVREQGAQVEGAGAFRRRLDPRQ